MTRTYSCCDIYFLIFLTKNKKRQISDFNESLIDFVQIVSLSFFVLTTAQSLGIKLITEFLVFGLKYFRSEKIMFRWKILSKIIFNNNLFA